MGKTTPKVPFFKDSGHCPKILDYTLDVLAISETNLDDSWPVGQFKILGYASPFRLD